MVFVDKGSFADDTITRDIIKQAHGYLGLSVVTDTGPAASTVTAGNIPSLRPNRWFARIRQINPDTNEYYDSSIVEWDSVRQRYVELNNHLYSALRLKTCNI